MSANIYQLSRIPILKRTTGYYLRWWYNGWHHWYFYAGGLALKTTGEDYRTYGQRTITVNSGQLTGSQANAVRTIANSTEVYVFTDTGWRLVRLVAGAIQVQNNIIDGYALEFSLEIGSRLVSATGFSPVTDVPISPPSDQCEVTIGAQIWMCKNWDAPYPASKVYNDDETNRALYGGLYDYDQIMSAGFVPAGWRVPTPADWDELIAHLGGLTVAGGKLKATGLDYWLTPNTDATDEVDFDGRGGGLHGLGFGYFNLRYWAYYWDTGRRLILLGYDRGTVTVNQLLPPTVYSYRPFASVRLIKIEPYVPQPLVDKDGNEYTVVTVGTQEWCVENMMVNIAGSRVYDDDPANEPKYGRLYTDPMCADADITYLERGGVQETGWRIASKADWDGIIALAGGAVTGGNKLKEAGTDHWIMPFGTDDYGLRFRGCGNYNAGYQELRDYGTHWTSSFRDFGGTLYRWAKELEAASGLVTESFAFPAGAMCGVRLVRDI